MARLAPLTRSLSALTLALSAIFVPMASHAFADDDARKAILELRQQIQAMTEANQRARIQLADQIETLQKELIQVRGELEQMGRPNRANGAEGATSGNAQAHTSQDPTEQSAYDGAIDQFRKGQYKDSAESLAAFLALFPNSTLAPSASFYLGSSRYGLKDYKGAIDQLIATVQKYPNLPRAPDALLVIAGSQIELNDRKGAKVTLQRIVKDYKGTPAAETAAKRLQLLQ
jgi:tol-pal system protein YbgF